MLKFQDCISDFNVTAYPDLTFDASGGKRHLVVLDRFTSGKEESWIGNKIFYFSDYAYYNTVLDEDTIESLWVLPEYTKITGSKTVWQVS